MAKNVIAISYRREDAPGTAGRIYDYLTRKIDRKHFFIDEDIELGEIFTRKLDSVFIGCKVLLVVIGKDWMFDKDGNNRFDDPDDFVRREVTTVMRRGEDPLVIPLLIGGTKMPDGALLPEEMQGLVRCQALNIGYQKFKNDTVALLDALVTHFHRLGIELTPPPGITDVVDRFPIDDVREMMGKAKQMRILHTWTTYISYGQWEIVQMLHNGGHIEILLLDPTCPAAQQRGEDSKENISSEIVQTLQRIDTIRLDSTVANKKNVRVRLYSNLPYTPIYILDKTVIIGYYPYNARSHVAPHLIVQGLKTDMGRYAVKQFTELWKLAKSDFDLDNLDSYLKENFPKQPFE